MSKQSIRLTDGSNTIYPECAESGTGYCKMADGTLMQWGMHESSQTLVEDTTHFGTTAYMSSSRITFSISFVSTPVILAWVNIGNGYTLTPWISKSLNECTIKGISYYVSGTENVSCDWIAIGRWK